MPRWLDPIQAIAQTCTKGILGEILNHTWRWIHRYIVPIECDCFWQQYQSLQMTIFCKLFENWCRQAVFLNSFFLFFFWVRHKLNFVDFTFLSSPFNSNICHLRYNKIPSNKKIAWYSTHRRKKYFLPGFVLRLEILIMSEGPGGANHYFFLRTFIEKVLLDIIGSGRCHIKPKCQF